MPLALKSEYERIDRWAFPHAKIRLENPKRVDLQALEVDALADTGALFLCIPEAVQIQLQLEATSKKEVTTADGNAYFALMLVPFALHLRIVNAAWVLSC